MALTQPYDLLSDFPGWVTSFDLFWRQEQSRQAGGRTIVKNLGSPLWQLKAQTKQLSPNELDYWRARLSSLENGAATFRGYSLSRTYPINHPKGAWGGGFDGVSANLAAVNANRRAVRVGGLPADFEFSPGDYIAIGNDLHQVMEVAAASGGTTPEFEVRPGLWPGVTSGTVSVKAPSCIMAIVPGSISSESGLNGWGSVAFQAIEAR